MKKGVKPPLEEVEEGPSPLAATKKAPKNMGKRMQK